MSAETEKHKPTRSLVRFHLLYIYVWGYKHHKIESSVGSCTKIYHRVKEQPYISHQR